MTTDTKTRHVDYLVKLASENACKGVIEEPRVYYDTITLAADGVVSEADRATFINGEQFPVRITHFATYLRPNFDQATGLDERFIQRVGLRLMFHDQYYQSREFVPAPLWSNKVVAGPAPLTTGFVSHTFERPVILSARDSLRVDVALESTPTYPRLVSVSFTGVGMLSKRPYFLASKRELADTIMRTLDTADFRNDGAEPIALTDMVVHCGAEELAQTGAGDVRQVRVQIQQIGNGTNARWFVGPTNPPLAQCPAPLLGLTQGRAIIHQIPGEGVLLEPAEGIIPQAIALAASVEGLRVGFAMLGYISLT